MLEISHLQNFIFAIKLGDRTFKFYDSGFIDFPFPLEATLIINELNKDSRSYMFSVKPSKNTIIKSEKAYEFAVIQIYFSENIEDPDFEIISKDE